MFIFVIENSSAASIFDTRTGLRYRITWIESDNRLVNPVMLYIDSAHTGFGPDHYPLAYSNTSALRFWKSLAKGAGAGGSITDLIEKALADWEQATGGADSIPF